MPIESMMRPAQSSGTGTLIESLTDDFNCSVKKLLKAIEAGHARRDGRNIADPDFEARLVINAAIAYFEGTAYALKIAALDDCMTNRQAYSAEDLDMVFEIHRYVSRCGVVVARPRKIELGRNLRFGISLYERAHCLSPRLALGHEKWWHLLRRSLKVRQRFTVPRADADLWIQPNEALDAVEAVSLFSELIIDLTNRARTSRKRANARASVRRPRSGSIVSGA